MTQLSLWNGTNTPAEPCDNAPLKAGSPACTCGKATYPCSIHPNTPDEWTASMQDSLAKICQSLETVLDSAKAHEAGCIGKSSVSLAWYDQNSYSWRTYQQSLVEGWESYSETFPRAGTMQNGCAYELPMLERPIIEIGGSCLRDVPTPTVCGNNNRKGLSQKSGDGLATWAKRKMMPTPCASDATAGAVIGENDVFVENKNGTLRKVNKNGVNGSLGLGRYVKMFPTPCSRDYKGGRKAETLSKAGRTETNSLPDYVNAQNQATGQLNPQWVEWLMGWPQGWTESKP